jgi:hypothetical protein
MAVPQMADVETPRATTFQTRVAPTLDIPLGVEMGPWQGHRQRDEL